MKLTRSDVLAGLAVAIALVALAFPAGSQIARIGAATLAIAVGLAVLAVSLRRLTPRLRRRYQRSVQRDIRRTAEARGDPLQVFGIGEMTQWRLSDGAEVTYVASQGTYQRLVQQGRVDPRTTFVGRGPPRPTMPKGWIRRWKARRRARRQSG